MRRFFSDNFFSNIFSAKITKEKIEDKIPFRWDKKIVKKNQSKKK